MKVATYFLIMIVLLSACKNNTANKSEEPVARVFNNYLYPSDFKEDIPAGISPADSLAVIQDYIETWIRNQLFLNKAEQNLTESEKDVESQIESYRSSLLIYAYQQSYLRENLDTVVTDSEIEQYYNDNQPNFWLDEPLIKGLFIKVSSSLTDVYKVRQWYRSDNPEAIQNLEAYCYTNATVYDHFNEDWINLYDVLQRIPTGSNISETSLLSRKYMETRDEDYLYFLRITEGLGKGLVAPLEYVKNDINYIILNKRKIKLINELESSMYSDAQNRKYFTIF